MNESGVRLDAGGIVPDSDSRHRAKAVVLRCAVSALAPFTIGALADRFGLGPALATTSAFFLIGAAMILLLPETRGTDLVEPQA